MHFTKMIICFTLLLVVASRAFDEDGGQLFGMGGKAIRAGALAADENLKEFQFLLQPEELAVAEDYQHFAMGKKTEYSSTK